MQDDGKVVFPFKEVLAFRLPLLHPKVRKTLLLCGSPCSCEVPRLFQVRLSGRVELTRNGEGLIIYSREHWDQSVADVLKTAFI